MNLILRFKGVFWLALKVVTSLFIRLPLGAGGSACLGIYNESLCNLYRSVCDLPAWLVSSERKCL